MEDFGLMCFTILAGIGLCFIIGVCTQGTEKDERDSNSIVRTFMRGLGFCILGISALSFAGGIIYLICSIF